MTIEIITENITIPNEDIDIFAYLAYPSDEGTHPAIIVIQEIFGVNDHIRDVTRRIAREGYIAVAPAIYQRIAPGFDTGYTAKSIEIGREYKNRTTAAELKSDIQATIDYLYRLPKVKTTGIGSIGFCFGGHVVYLAATLDEIKVTASFYGAGITTGTPGGGEATLRQTPQIKGTIYAFFGMLDASIPVSQVNEIEDTLARYRIPHQVFRYEGADHGFFCDQRGSYQPAAAADAWNHVLELFKRLES